MTLGAVFVASLLGSLHCFGMCGGFSAMVGVAGAAQRTPAQRAMGIVAYHAARVFAYALLGLGAGAVGSGLELFGRSAGLQRFAGVSMGSLLIVMSLRSLWPSVTQRSKGRVAQPLTPLRGAGGGYRTWFVRAQAWLARTSAKGGWRGPMAAGLLASLLPCLWLWSYVAFAAGSGSGLSGALVMLAFGLGTVPALLVAGTVASLAVRRWAKHAPQLVAMCLLGLGIASVAGWTQGPIAPPLAAPLSEIPTDAACHSPAASPPIAGAQTQP